MGGILVGLGGLMVLLPVDGADEGRSCGGAMPVATAVGLDSAAEGDGGWCRSESRSIVAGGVFVFALPGALLLRWQMRAVRRAQTAEADPMGGSPSVDTSGWSASPRDALPDVVAPSDVVPGSRVDLYLGPQRAGLLLLLAAMLFFVQPVMWVVARAGVLGLRHRPVLTLDDTGLTDHRYGVELPWPLLRGITLTESGGERYVDIDVSDLRPLRPRWRLGAVMRWSALRLTCSGHRIRVDARWIDGIEAFVGEAASRIHPVPDAALDRRVHPVPGAGLDRRIHPVPAAGLDRLDLYRSPWWLAGLPLGVAIVVLWSVDFLTPDDGDAPSALLLLSALWLLWRGAGAVRGRPLLVLDRHGVTDRRIPRFRATWDEVAAVEFLPRTSRGASRLLVRLHHDRNAPHRWPRSWHPSPAERRLYVDGLSAPAHEIAKAAERLHAPRDGDAAPHVTNRGRPNRLAAVAAIATAIILAGIGWYIRPSGDTWGDLQPGDCYSTSGADQIEEASCDRPHDGEVFRVVDHPADRGARRPSSSSLSAWARCEPALSSYTGRSRPLDDGLALAVWLPSAASWTEGAREITCVVVNESGAQLTHRVGAS